MEISWFSTSLGKLIQVYLNLTTDVKVFMPLLSSSYGWAFYTNDVCRPAEREFTLMHENHLNFILLSGAFNLNKNQNYFFFSFCITYCLMFICHPQVHCTSLPFSVYWTSLFIYNLQFWCLNCQNFILRLSTDVL